MARPDELAGLAQDLGIADLLDFRPPVAPAELADLYAAADLVAMPSYSESFGLVAVEAQACGHAGGGRVGGRSADGGGRLGGRNPGRRTIRSSGRTNWRPFSIGPTCDNGWLPERASMRSSSAGPRPPLEPCRSTKKALRALADCCKRSTDGPAETVRDYLVDAGL